MSSVVLKPPFFFVRISPRILQTGCHGGLEPVLEAGEPGAPSKGNPWNPDVLLFVGCPLQCRNPSTPILFRKEREHFIRFARPPRPASARMNGGVTRLALIEIGDSFARAAAHDTRKTYVQ